MWELVVKYERSKAFSLIELLVVIAVISLLMGIMMPVLGKARQQARAIQGMNNQKQTVLGINLFAADNDGRYPESVATITIDNATNVWRWQEPTMMTACRPRPSRTHRSMSEYLGYYIEDTDILFCPSAPKKYEHLQDSWDAGDEWDLPDTSSADAVCGTYGFYWNYNGFLEGCDRPFTGPWNSAGGRGQSKLLVSCYFGFGNWRNKNIYGLNTFEAYGSCERFGSSRITPETDWSSAFWSRLDINETIALETLKIKPYAGYTDGHVKSFSPEETISMRVSQTPDGSEPYPDGPETPGIFYLPKNAL